MQILKWLLGIVVVLVIVAVGGGMVLSPTFKVQRSATIQAPAQKVYELLADPRQWKAWSAWNRRETILSTR